MSFGIIETLIVAGVSLIGAAIVASLAYLVVSMVRKRNEPQPKAPEE